MIFEEYRKSLKMPEAEEVFDLIFFRPVAYGFVKLIYRLPITPNQISFCSMVCALVAAHEFSIGTPTAFLWAACWYAIANVFDCSDGQLARLQNSGTMFGRIVDGIADYISTIAIFGGIGFGLQLIGHPAWLLVIAAGLSSGLHAMFFDHYQGEFISTVRGEINFLKRELAEFSLERERANNRGHRVQGFIILLYIHYLEAQKRLSTKRHNHLIDSETYRSMNALPIRLWSFLGPTTNRTLLILCAVFNRIDIYLWVICCAGNLWLIIMYVMQRNIHAKLALQTLSDT
ncbi:MAG: CDP-alcohol phosphatidyltransferase family protein [Bacteroidota bacterium]